MTDTKRKLKKVHFNFEGNPHVAYTSWDQGGAASGENDPYLLKCVEVDKSLTKHQQALLTSMGLSISEDMIKSLSSEKNSGLSSPDGASQGEQPENKTNEGKTMSVDKNAEDRIVALEKALAKAEAKAVVMPYQFDAEISKGLVEALAELSAEDQVKVTKALDALVSAKEVAVTKAKEEAVVEKSKEKSENDLAKSLQEEAGHSEEQKSGVEKSKLEKIAEETNKLVEKAKKGAKN